MHNPYNNQMYLYVARKTAVLLLQWYEPLQKFMIVRVSKAIVNEKMQQWNVGFAWTLNFMMENNLWILIQYYLWYVAGRRLHYMCKSVD